MRKDKQKIIKTKIKKIFVTLITRFQFFLSEN